jgi:DUF4097 and DUF4098 domain-containing protein YvlB
MKMRTIMLSLLIICVASVAQANDGTFDRKVAAEPHGTVEISNVAGQIEVTGWDSPQVEVHADMGAGVDRIDVTSDHGRTSVKVIVPNHSFRSISTKLLVRVPKDSELDISGVSADVVSTDVQGALQLKTVSGDVQADIFQGTTEIKTVSGDVVLRGRGQSAGLHVSTVSGNIKVDRGAGDLDATTVSGDLNIHLDPSRSVRVRTTSGDFGFEGKLLNGGSIDAETISGDFNVRAAVAGLDYEVATFSGDIKDCMGVEAEDTSRYGPGKRLHGRHGASGADSARVRLKTMSGDVELCDRL